MAHRSSAPVRVLDDRDLDEVLALCDRDPAANVFVSSRVRSGGLDPGALGAQMWGYYSGRRLESVCYAGANLVPVEATACRDPRLRGARAQAGTPLLVVGGARGSR